MKSMLGLCAALVLWACSATPSHAFGCAVIGPAFCCPPVCCVSYQYQTVNSYRPQWVAEKVPCVVQKVSYRQEIDKVKVTVMVPQMFDQTVRVSFYVPNNRVVEQPVTSCVMQPMTVVDPCTGCCYVTYCPKLVTTMVKVNVCDYQLQARDEVVKVCRMVPEQRVVDQVRCVPVVTQEQSWTVQYKCVMVPCQTTVCVPVYTWCCP